MIERVYFPIHGNARGGTGYSFYGGFAYGAVDPVTLKADRPTDLFAPSLTTEVEDAAAASAGDTWAREAVREAPRGRTTHTPRVRPAPAQPPLASVTQHPRGSRAERSAVGKQRASMAKTQRQVAAVQAAIARGRLDPHQARERAERAAEHGAQMGARAHEAYNAIALLEAQIQRDAQPGQSLAAHRRVLAKMRTLADRLQSIAARDQALHRAVSAATQTAARQSGYRGFGAAEPTDARAAEEQAADLVAAAADAIAAGNVAGAEVEIANAEGAFQTAHQRMTAEAAAGDVFAEVSAALEPSRIPWAKVGVAVGLLALARQMLR